MNDPSACPSQHKLRDFFAGDLDGTTAEMVRKHLESCERCRRLASFVAELTAPPSQPTDVPSGTGVPHGASAITAGSAKPEDADDSDASLDLNFLQPSADKTALGKLGDYDVLTLLGRGAMGVVFKAFDPTLCRTVAIKVLSPPLAASTKAHRRFLREARAAANINHPNVVTIHAVDEQAGLPYLVMEYLTGQTLRQRIRSGKPFDLTSLLRIGAQIAAGLAAAHKHGVIHRDIKPANIMLEDGIERVKITDFGLALAAMDASQITSAGLAVGTPAYMSPEQVNGETLDARSDLFSLGCVLYSMVAGQSPFQASHPLEVARKVREETPLPLHDLNAEVPKFFSDMVVRLMEKRRQDRFASAEEVEQILLRYLAQANLGQYGLLTQTETLTVPRRPRRKWLGATAAVLVMLVAAGLFIFRPWQAQPSGEFPGDVLTVGQGKDAHFSSLTEALTRARPGNTIRILDDRVYRGSVRIHDAERLKGLVIEAPAHALLENPGSPDPVVSIIGTGGVVLRGVHVRAQERQHAISIKGRCSGLLVEDVGLTQPAESLFAAIVLWPDSGGTREQPVVLSRLNLRCGGIGLAAIGKQERPVSWLRVENSRFAGPGFQLVLETALDHVTVSGNIFSLGTCGVSFSMDQVKQSKNVHIANNSFFKMTNWLGFTKSSLDQEDITIANNLILATGGIQLSGQNLAEVAARWFRDNWWEGGSDPKLVSLVAANKKDVRVWSREPESPDFLRPVPGSMPPGNNRSQPAYIGALQPAPKRQAP